MQQTLPYKEAVLSHDLKKRFTAYIYTDRDLIKTNLTTKVLFEHVIAPLPENLTCNLDGSVHRRCNHRDRDIFSKYIYTYISLVDRINLKIVITLKNIYLCTFEIWYIIFFLWFIFLLQSGLIFICLYTLHFIVHISENLGKICIFCNFKKYYIVCYTNEMLFYTCMNIFVFNRNLFSTTTINQIKIS